MNCPQCKSIQTVKKGIAKSMQRYLCKKCAYQFTIAEKYVPKSKKNNYGRRALLLLLEGFSSGETASLLNISPTTILTWKKEWKSILKLNRNTNSQKLPE